MIDRTPSHAAVAAALTFMLAATAGMARADVIVQSGSLDGGGGGGPETIDIVLDQFDPALGTLQEIRLDLFSSVIGGGMSNGSGVPTHVSATLTADYSLAGDPLGGTEAVIDFVVSNVGAPQSFTLFDNDSDLVVIDDAPGLAPWIGGGDLTMTALVSFVIFEDPPDSVGFGAGGSVDYTVTYDFTPVPAPSAIAAIVLAGAFSRRRR